jgi:hypothetical protein
MKEWEQEKRTLRLDDRRFMLSFPFPGLKKRSDTGGRVQDGRYVLFW